MIQHHRCGYVAIVGRPNVGKSTLLNQMIGQKLAITSYKSQTTRHSILGIKTCANGQILFVDTPGLHLSKDNVFNRELNRIAKDTIANANTILLVLEAGRWTQEDAMTLDAITKFKIPCIAVLNKIDRLSNHNLLLPYINTLSQRYKFYSLIPISAQKNIKLDLLEQEILNTLPVGEAKYPTEQLSDRPLKFFAAEFLREQLTRFYAQELPYQLSVDIEQFQESKKLNRIVAIIWVQRSTQKAIIIGKRGLALKTAASEARLAMEKFFEKKVYLEVVVKVAKQLGT
jgi:GTP-binding protein Era